MFENTFEKNYILFIVIFSIIHSAVDTLLVHRHRYADYTHQQPHRHHRRRRPCSFSLPPHLPIPTPTLVPAVSPPRRTTCYAKYALSVPILILLLSPSRCCIRVPAAATMNTMATLPVTAIASSPLTHDTRASDPLASVRLIPSACHTSVCHHPFRPAPPPYYYSLATSAAVAARHFPSSVFCRTRPRPVAADYLDQDRNLLHVVRLTIALVVVVVVVGLAMACIPLRVVYVNQCSPHPCRY